MRKSELDIEKIMSEDVTIPENVLKAKKMLFRKYAKRKTIVKQKRRHTSLI